MKPDFDRMSVAELRAYLLAHRNDNEAFYKLADRLEAGSDHTVRYPAPDSPETIALMEAVIQEQVQRLEEKRQD
jgi:hypothetical protein